MPNASLANRIEAALAAARAAPFEPEALARLRQALNIEGAALEAMPYALIKECDNLAYEIQVAEWLLQEETLPEVVPLLTRVDSWLRRVRDAAV